MLAPVTCRAQIIGRLPREVLEGDLAALVSGQQLPYARYVGNTSAVTAPDVKTAPSADPRGNR